MLHGEYTTVQLAVLLFASASAVVGLGIAGLAFRALLRNRNRQMLYLGVGMVLLFGVAYGISIAGALLIELEHLEMGSQDLFRLGVRVTQFVGLCCIGYSLWLGRAGRASS